MTEWIDVPVADCGGDITRLIRKAIKSAQSATGSKGGSTKGATKRRNVDYAALARKGAEARAARKALDKADLTPAPDSAESS